MNSFAPIYIFVMAIAIFMLWNIFFNRNAVVKRKIRNTPLRKINEFQEGEVMKTTGRIVYAGKTLIAPLSGRKCSYYHVLVEEHRSDGETSSWSKFIEEEAAGDVIIKDGNDHAVITTTFVKGYLVHDAQYISKTGIDATPVLEGFLLKHGQKSTGLFGFNKSLRYKEGVLEEGELLAVVGKGKWKNRKEIQLDIPSERILFLGRNGEEPVYFSNDPAVTL